MATAAWESEVVPRAMAVSDRARLPTSMAWRNSRVSTGPAEPSARASSQESRTWWRISPSPMMAESMPDATWKRWATAPSS